MVEVSHRSNSPQHAKRERMELAGADAADFLEAVAAPPKPADRLVKALQEHKSIAG